MRSLCWIIFLILSPTWSWGQVDPSSALLLQGGSASPLEDSALNSGRYTKKREAPPIQNTQPLQGIGENTGSTETTSIEKGEAESEEPPESISQPQLDQGNEVMITPYEEEEPEEFVDRLRNAILGGSGKKIQHYYRLLEREDVRKNLVELEIAPTLIYNDSSSSYSYRRYHLFSQGLLFSGRMWFTPFFAINFGYQTSLGGDIKGSATSRLPVSHQWFNVGVRFRRFFGMRALSPSLIFGLDFSEYQFKVPTDDTLHTRIKSSGLRILLEGRFRKTSDSTRIIGFSIIPKTDHIEQATGIEIKSGDRSNSNRIGFHLGGEILFDRKSQFIWGTEYLIEKNLFTGQANTADLKTGSQPEGVSVLNSFMIFHFGYRWAD